MVPPSLPSVAFGDSPPYPPFVISLPHFKHPQKMLSTFFPTTYIFYLAAALLFASVRATPLPDISEIDERGLETRGVSLLSAADISGFTPFTQFARAAYCQQSKVKDWSCGGELSLFSVFDRDRRLED